MQDPYPHWTHRGKRMVSSLLSLLLIWTMVAGGFVGPWLQPAPTHAAGTAQQIEAISIGQSEESDFSPDGYASYGEVITYTLRFTVGQGVHNSIVITDTFGTPSGSYYLAVTPTTSVGPVPVTSGAFDPTDVAPTITFPPALPGRPVVRWALLESIDNSSGSDWIYEIRFRALVHIDSQTPTRPDRKTSSIASIRWHNGSAADGAFLVTLVQPLSFTLNKSQAPTSEISPGQTFTWTITMRNPPGSTQGTAYDLLITDTLPGGIITDTFTYPPTSTLTVIGNEVIFTLPYLNPFARDTIFRIRSHLSPVQNLAHGPLYNEVNVYRSSAPGDALGERVWVLPDSYTGLIRNIDLTKSATTMTAFNNTAVQAVGGEYVDITVNVRVPQGLVIYDPIVRILLMDGMTLTEALTGTTWPDNILFDPDAQDEAAPNGYWTQYEWNNLDSITDTNSNAVTLTFNLRAQVRHRYFNPFSALAGTEIGHGEDLDIVPIVRWAPEPGGTVYEGADCDPNEVGLCKRNTASPSIDFIRPDLRQNAVNNGSWFTTAGSFEGGGILAFTLHLDNRTGRPTAYDPILEQNLSPGLEYVPGSANPPAASVITGTGGTTITWNVATPISDNTLEFVVEATLPPSMAVGFAVTTTAYARYSTFDGAWPDEGQYYDHPPAVNPPYTARQVLQGGFDVEKYVSPADYVKIGDAVDYTLQMTVNPNMVMYLPTFDDTLPKGFHYIEGSLSVEGGQLLTGSVSFTGTGASDYQEILSWGLLTIDNRGGSTPQYITVQYRARLKGLDFRWEEENHDGNPVYAVSRANMVGKISAVNTVAICWSSGPGETIYCLDEDSMPTAETKVVQPYLADSPPWAKVRTDPTDEYEVGDDVYFKVTLKNSGQGMAYEVDLEDVLPQGIAFKDTLLTLTPPDPTVTFLHQPVVNATGAISWTLNHVAAGTTVELSYRTQVISTALPGIALTNLVRIIDYTSQADYPDYDRHYADFDGAFSGDPIPAPKSCAPFVVLGVGLRKVDEPDPVAPGAMLTYTVYFSNTSGRYSAVNVRITDTYDADLTYLGAEVSDSRIEFVGAFPPRTLVWRVYTMPNNDPTLYWIRPRFTVAAPFDPGNAPLVNLAGIDGGGDATSAVWREEPTDIMMPALAIRKTGTPPSVVPGGKIVYTLRFTNTTPYDGMTATDVVIEELYDANVSYYTSSVAPIAGTTDQWAWADMPKGAIGTFKVAVLVDKPLPAGVVSIINQARISCAEASTVYSPEYQTGVNAPALNVGTTDWPDPVNRANPLQYTIGYTNNGSLGATAITFTNTLDPYVTFVSATPPPVGGSCPGNVCTWNLPQLNPGGYSSIIINVTVKNEVPCSITRLTNRATIQSAEVGPRTDIEYTALPPANCSYSVYLPLVLRNDQ